MPIKIPSGLPARETLENEHVFVMDETRAVAQDIRPLKIIILNLMPTKITTETQLIRLLSNSPLQVELTLLRTATHRATHTPEAHMEAFYQSYDDIKDSKFDGMIITGAPVENLQFSEVTYWNELCNIMEWSKSHVYSTLYICWAAQAGLFYHFGLPKETLPEKLSGVFLHRVLMPKHPLVRGFNEEFYAPHSRYTGVRAEDISKAQNLDLLADSLTAGAYLAASRDCRMFFVTGHPEYDADTIAAEYERDLKKGINPALPKNYFPCDDPKRRPHNVWRAHANLLFANWLNYFVYQRTPYDLSTIGE